MLLHKEVKVIFLHGFLGCKDDFDEVIRGLPTNWDVLSLNLPGHGGEPIGDLDSLAKRIPPNAHIVGYSMGGRIALWLASRDPHFASSLSILSANPGLGTDEERTARSQIDLETINTLKANGVESFIHDWYAQPMFKNSPIPKRRFDQNLEGLTYALQNFSIAKQPSFWDDLLSFNCQLRFGFGTLDEKYASIANKLTNQSINVQMADLCTHPIHLQNPQFVTNFVTESVEEILCR